MVKYAIVKEYPLIVLIRTYPNTKKRRLPTAFSLARKKQALKTVKRPPASFDGDDTVVEKEESLV